MLDAFYFHPDWALNKVIFLYLGCSVLFSSIQPQIYLHFSEFKLYRSKPLEHGLFFHFTSLFTSVSAPSLRGFLLVSIVIFTTIPHHEAAMNIGGDSHEHLDDKM